MVASFSQRTRSQGRRLLLRGESAIASSGLVLAAIVLGMMSASAWWSAHAHDAKRSELRAREVDSIGTILAELVTEHLTGDAVSATRRLVADTARRNDLSDCRVVLPGGQVVAAASASQITLATLPETWPGDVHGEDPATPDAFHAVFPIDIPGRGAARLVIAAPSTSSPWGLDTAQAGIGLIGAAALVAILLVYRRMRSRMQALSFIREGLLALEAGETSMAALTVQPGLGPEAVAWNEMLAERERFQQVLVTRRLLELPAARQDRARDLTSVCDALSQGLVLVDQQLRATYVNEAAALYLGTSREQTLGVAFSSGAASTEVLDLVRGVASGDIRRATSVEVEHGDENANVVLRFGVRPVRRDDSCAAMIVIEDVTQQRLANESRNSFVAQVTHELRAPLTNILLYAETAMDEGDTDPQQKTRALNVINQEAKRLERIVSDMLSVAELEAGTHEVRLDDVDLSTLFRELNEDYTAFAGRKQITLEFNLPPKLPSIQADRDKITLALHNLVGNALKYTPDEGHVVVDVDCDEKQLQVKVSDNGIGLRPEEHERVFEKFYRAKDERVADVTGSGLGLALSREVIRLHGGDINLESELNRGSTFTLTLPVALARAA